jgi:hypothetical protein
VSLKIDPFSCRNLYYQFLAFDALGNKDEAEKCLNKFKCIIDAMSLTGDGLTKETAIHVISVSNEYDFLFDNGFSMQNQAFVNGGFDVLKLKPNEAGVEELWFDVNKPFNTLIF